MKQTLRDRVLLKLAQLGFSLLMWGTKHSARQRADYGWTLMVAANGSTQDAADAGVRLHLIERGWKIDGDFMSYTRISAHHPQAAWPHQRGGEQTTVILPISAAYTRDRRNQELTESDKRNAARQANQAIAHESL